jgi:peptide/nickel transport system substrate-binding protein
LLSFDSAGRVQPGLASSWTQASPTVYTYTIKSGERFSDGKPVTPTDILYSVHYMMNPKTGGQSAGYFTNVKSITADGGDQIRVTLTKPQSDWNSLIAGTGLSVFEKSALEAAGSKFGSPSGIPIGSGPYKITEFTNDHATFVPNPYYDGPPPKVQRVVVQFITDDATRRTAMESGDLDGTSFVPPTETPQWERVASVNLQSVLSGTFFAWLFNPQKPPFNDIHVRRAIMYAFNREAIIKDVLHGNAALSRGMVVPQFFVNEMSSAQAEERINREAPEYPFDMERAKAELAKSPVPGGFSFTALTTELKEETLTLQVLKQQLKALGIEMKVQTVSPTVQYEKLEHGEFSALTSVGVMEPLTPLGFLNALLCSCQLPPLGDDFWRYKNAEVDRLLSGAFASTDPTKIGEDNIRVLAIAQRDLPITTAWYDKTIVALNKKYVLTDFGSWSMLETPWMANIRAVAG